MFAVKRIDKIKDFLRQYKQIDISSLSSILSVSEATVRRDLDKLEMEGFIKRTHGGAILVEDPEDDFSLQELVQVVPNLEEKEAIGFIASNMVNNNDVIIIGAGSTCYQMAKQLKNKKNLTIVTNNVLIGIEYSANREIKVILTGGETYQNNNSISLVGDFSNKMLEGIYVSQAFIGVDGVDFDSGFTVNSSELGLVWNSISKVSGNLIVLADYTKFGKKGFVKCGSLDEADKIVTNDKVPDEYKQYFFEKGIPLFTKYNLEE
ncbi:DeoR/GlpR family DNA-binding transcription regulator [Cohnella hongkongensis]|uniref:DeoR/GlpR family DNA-binding transcription regulator n=1 Tax=Cohnella hongkongensis TaxID=178337 RepID=A0ABV9FIW7_9BACL